MPVPTSPTHSTTCCALSSLSLLCAGDHLDPQEVLQALPPGMPLAAAAAVLAPMMRDRLHRRRQVLCGCGAASALLCRKGTLDACLRQ